MNDGIPTPATTSAGMPPLATTHDALLDQPRRSDGPDRPHSTTAKAHRLIDEGKAHVTGLLEGIAAAANQFADQLDTGPGKAVAGYARQAAVAVTEWSLSLDNKSVEEIAGDVRSIVRQRPALTVGAALVAGFVLSRALRADHSRS